jgi:hypothetical protein
MLCDFRAVVIDNSLLIKNEPFLYRFVQYDARVAFDEQEIKEVVFPLPSVKAPGPDGFIGAFFKACWYIIKEDIVAAIVHMAKLRGTAQTS